MTTPAQRTPRTWQWAVKTEEGYRAVNGWSKRDAESAAWFMRQQFDSPRVKVVKVAITELPAARQRRGKA